MSVGTGIYQVNPVLRGIKYCWTGHWLDLSPCKYFTLIVQRELPANCVAANPLWICAQYEPDNVGAQESEEWPVGTINDIYAGWMRLHASAYVFPAGTAFQGQFITLSVGPGLGNPAGVMLFGPRVRFQLNWLTLAQAGGDTSTYFLTVYGTT
jgi:hypothetical protein